MRSAPSRTIARPPRLSRLLRRARWTSLACVLLCALGSAAYASSGAISSAPVTARPPLEAVPAAPVTRAQQARAHECAGIARSRQLHGAKRAAFIKSCMAAPRLKAGPASH